MCRTARLTLQLLLAKATESKKKKEKGKKTPQNYEVINVRIKNCFFNTDLQIWCITNMQKKPFRSCNLPDELD